MRYNRLLRFATATLVAAGATLTATGPSAPATAAPEPAPAAVIVCTLMAHYPHNSGHVKSTINVVSDIICSADVDSIYIATGLRGTQSANGWNQAYATNYAESNPAKPCVSGTYWGIASTSVTFPSGYSPRTQSKEAAGVTRDIVCGSRSATEQTSVVLGTFVADYVGE